MLVDFNQIFEKYQLSIDGIIHIGAHYGEEIDVYEHYNINNIILFEPVPSSFHILKEKCKNKYDLYNLALGNENKKVIINLETANNGQSNSILNPKLHLQQYPNIKFESKIEVDMMKLDDVMDIYHQNNNKKFNFVNIDVQGYELEVFKGSINYLKNIDYIYTEVNRDYVYDNCVLIDKLDEFLHQFNFKRVETNWSGNTWGDAFYMKTN